MENLDTLFLKLKNGDTSVRNTIIESQMPLVYSIAKKYFKYIDSDVAVQEGSIGLINAVDRFDIDKGFKFSTFAFHYIDGTIKKYIREYNDNFSIRLKRGDYDLLLKIKEAEDTLYKKLQRVPNIDELSEYLKVDRDKIVEILLVKEVKSMDYEITGKDEKVSSTYEIVEDTSINLEKDSIDRLMVEEALNVLDDRERIIIEQSYFKGLTQAEISEIVGLSQVQVSRILRKALAKMQKAIKDQTSSFLYKKNVIKENKSKGEENMSKANNLADLNNILFEQLEKLSNPNLKDKELKDEIERSQAIAKVASQIINNGSLVLRIKSMQDTDNVDTPMLESTPSKKRKK